MKALSCMIWMDGLVVSWIVFGESFVQLYFGNVYVVMLGKIVLVILSCVRLC
jgi:hypothetical protein